MKGYEPGGQAGANQAGQGRMQQQGGMGGGFAEPTKQGGMGQGGMQGGQASTQGAMDQDGCVLTCTVAECGYNQDLECYAEKIQVGESHPTCDTYTPNQQVQTASHEGFVMTCGVEQCNFNDSQQCHARGITVDHHSQHADCVTFRP